jgi:hypothetical protein
MTIGNARASIFAIRPETVRGQVVQINNGAQFVPLRPGFNLARTVEQLANEELRSGIGEARSVEGKETVTGDFSAYLKNSGVEGQEPETGILWESALGEKVVNATEYDLVAGSTTTVLNVDVGEGANFYVGQALLIKDATNGFSIRNVAEINVDALTLNFPLSNAPAAGVALGKAVSYIPAADGFKTFSAHQYIGNGHSYVVSSGNEVIDVGVEFAANQYGELNFSFEGTNYRFNPVLIGATNKFIDWTDDDGTHAASIPETFYNNPVELASALAQAMNLESAETITVTYSNMTGKFTLAATGAVFSVLWFTGTNAANSIGATLGFNVSANDTGALFYISDDEQDYTSPIAPIYDTADPLVVKDVEFYIGDAINMMCRCATTASIAISKAVEDIDCICEETGTKGKIATQRTVDITAEIILDKHDVSLFKALKDNDQLQVMLNLGEKTGGNYVAGRAFNFYVPNAGVTEFSTAGDNFVVASIAVKGFVLDNKECFVNFV